MGIWSRLRGLVGSRESKPPARRALLRSDPLVFGGWSYLGGGLGQMVPVQTWGAKPVEPVPVSFEGFAYGALFADDIVSSCMAKRLAIFSEARLQWRAFVNGRPGDLFGTRELAQFETPWAGGTTGDLLARMIQDADLCGNAYIARPRRKGDLIRLRPDWVDIILRPRIGPWGTDGSDVALGWEKVGYFYYEGGQRGKTTPVVLLPDEVAHFAPLPDPLATYRGMSWITPVLRSVQADKGMVDHGIALIEHGGTPNMVLTMPREANQADLDLFKKTYAESHDGAENAYEPLFLAGGVEATVVGANAQGLDLAKMKTIGETRIVMAAGLHGVLLGTTEGMSGSSLNSGNYQAAKRAVADTTFRPLWRNAAASLEVLVDKPRVDVQLWFDERDIAFLRDDQTDRSKIQAAQATTIRQLLDAGFTADSVVKAVTNQDFTLLAHSGMFSVQLQPPGSGTPTPGTPPALPSAA